MKSEYSETSGPVNRFLGFPQRRREAAFTRLAAIAVLSGSLSTAIAAVSYGRLTQGTFHLLFVLLAGVIGLGFGGSKLSLQRLDAGCLLVLILMEPIGPILLYRETSLPAFGWTLLFGFAVAFFLGRAGVPGGSDQ